MLDAELPAESLSTKGKPKRRGIRTVSADSDVSEDNSTPPKRLRTSRVSRACDQCRNKKDRCDGSQPICTTCTLLGRICTYRSSPRKRGVPTGYIRTLEILWGIIFSEIRGSEAATQSLLRAKNILSHLTTVSRDGDGKDTYLAAWKKSAVLKDIERLLDQQEGDTTPVNFEEIQGTSAKTDNSSIVTPNFEWRIPNTIRDDQEFRHSGIAMLRSTKVPWGTTDTTSSTSPACKVNPDFREIRSSNILECSNANAPAIPFSEGALDHHQKSPLITLPENSWQLFDMYFTFTHCWFPIVEKHAILRTAFSYSATDASITASHPGSGDHAVMWAILALAAIQAASSNQHNPNYKGDIFSMKPDLYYNCARGLIPCEDTIYEATHIQALLILSLIKIGRQEYASAWILVGQATRISLYLGLDNPEKEVSPNQNQSSRDRFAFLGCFALETIIVNQIGRSPQLRKEHIAKIDIDYEEGLDEWQPWKNLVDCTPDKPSRDLSPPVPLHAISTFKKLISLLSMINDICCCIGEKDTKLSTWKSIDSALQCWKEELPKICHIEPRKDLMLQPLPHMIGLHLVSEYAIATLYRHVSNHQDIGSSAKKQFKVEVSERCKGIAEILQDYIRSYSISATTALFGVYIHFAKEMVGEVGRDTALSGEAALRRNIQRLSRQLEQMWMRIKAKDAEPDPILASTITKASYLSQSSEESSLLMAPNFHDAKALSHEPSDNSDVPRMPCSSFRSFNPQQYLQEGSREVGLHPYFVAEAGKNPNSNDPALIPPSSVIRHATYRVPYQASDATLYHSPQNSNMHNGAAPDSGDLAALLDELAAFDASDTFKHRPEFMQNLGFGPTSESSELFSYYNQLNPTS